MRRQRSAVAVVLLIGLLVLPSWALAQARVLLLPDVGDCPVNPRRACEGVVALVDYLRGAGHHVTVGPLEFRWDAANPPLDGFDAVVHLNGATFHTPLPVASQLALEEFVRTGGGYVGSQYNGFEVINEQQTEMPDLVLQLWPFPDNCSECEMTWTVVPGQETHPMLDGVPASFTFFADGHDAGPLVEFDEQPSSVLMTSPGGGPAVTVREFAEGRVVAFSSATNNSTVLTLQEPDILRLYANAVVWVTSSDEPTIETLQDAVDALAEAGTLTGGQATALTAKLEGAERMAERGDTRGAIHLLEIFIRQVETWIQVGILTSDEGRPLVDAALALIADLSD